MKKSVKYVCTAAAVVFTVGVIAIVMLLRSGPGMDAPASQPESGQPQEPAEPLVICVDLINADSSCHSGDSPFEQNLRSLAFRLELAGGLKDTQYQFEVLPPKGEKRETALTRLRTEIMGGGGPDVFILAAGYETMDLCAGTSVEPLFPFPEKAMRNNLFMKLDDYIKDAKFMEWEKLTPQVMEAGRNEDGQYLLPLGYTFPVTVFRAADWPEEIALSAETTWDDMLNDKTGCLTAICDPFALFGRSHVRNYFGGVSGLFGEYVDYETESFRFTEEEFVQRIKEMREICVLDDVYGEASDFTPKDFALWSDTLLEMYPPKDDGLPPHYSVNMFPFYRLYQRLTGATFDQEKDGKGIGIEEDLKMAPLYSVDGGVTATVIAYAGINANTKQPDNAFHVLDFLLSKEGYENLGILENCLRNLSLPPYEDIMVLEGEIGFTDANLEELCRLREQITGVQFSTILDQYIRDLYFVPGGDKLDEKIAKTYQKMQLLLSE